MSWLERVLKNNPKAAAETVSRKEQTVAGIPRAAQAYLDKVHKKMDDLASDFARGTINRAQFQDLYSHYQKELAQIGSLLENQPEDWQKASSEGKSMVIRRQHLARAQAYAIYVNETGLPLGTIGKFRLDSALVVPMLSSYRSATQEIFGSGMRLTQVGEGQWLCFVPGRYTTLIAVFTNEPIAKQLEYLGDLHQYFEKANQPLLVNQPVNTGELIFPHEYFLGKWNP
jgi:hypothetical protein